MTMLCSKEKGGKKFAIKNILSIRGGQKMGDSSLRPRVLPYLNILATSLEDLISWKEAREPVIACKLTKAKLQEFEERPMEVQYYHCHTQPREREQ